MDRPERNIRRACGAKRTGTGPSPPHRSPWNKWVAIVLRAVHSRVKSMKTSQNLMPFSLLLLTAVFITLCQVTRGQTAPIRKDSEDVNAPELRVRPGLNPDKTLLFNGWGAPPAGNSAPISDLA